MYIQIVHVCLGGDVHAVCYCNVQVSHEIQLTHNCVVLTLNMCLRNLTWVYVYVCHALGC